MAKYFGTDGIRGKAYEFLTFELGFSLGKALSVLKNETLIIGRDTRESGVMLVDAITQGAKVSGIDVLDVGVVPTPELCQLSKELSALGVMVTASHNPYQDNGIKVFDSGTKIFLEKEQAIEDAMDGINSLPLPLKVGVDLPQIGHHQMYEVLYKDLLEKTDYRIGLDLANGAAYEVGKALFGLIAKELVCIGDSPDGKNINVLCGSTNPNQLVWTVKHNHLDFGFAVDGDGDRVLMINRDGKVYDGDLLIYVSALYLKEKGLLKKNTVVLTKMSNLGIIKAFKEKGINVVRTAVGDKYVLDEMNANGYVLGGENSGHIINRTLLETGDGILNAANIVRILHEWNTDIETLTQGIVMFPDKLVNLHNIDRTVLDRPAVQAEIMKVKEALGEDGSVLVRPSGTEPIVRVHISAPTVELVEQSIHSIVSVIEAELKNEERSDSE